MSELCCLVLNIGNYFEEYEVSDLCGQTDTSEVLVRVKPEIDDYCYPNRSVSPIDEADDFWISKVTISNHNINSGNDNGCRPGFRFPGNAMGRLLVL